MADAHATAGKYYVPHESRWPIIGSAAFFTLLLGVVALLNEWFGGQSAWAMVPGFALVVYMFIGWFSTVIDENQSGVYGLDVDRSFRMGMMWFIFSEVMFFAAFFGALFYARVFSVPWLGGEGTKVMGN
jgi:cytochrome c oxidase subunit 3